MLNKEFKKTSAKEYDSLVDLNDKCLEVIQAPNGWDECMARSEWRSKHFIYGRTHNETETIYAGKDGRTLLVQHTDPSRQYYPDEYWDFYQLQNDGTVSVKSLKLSEYDIGRGDSIQYVAASSEDKLTGDAAKILKKELAVSAHALNLFAMRQMLKSDGDKMFGRVSLTERFCPNGEETNADDPSVSSVLPQEVFSKEIGNADAGETRYKKLEEWIENSGLTQYRRQAYLVDYGEGRIYDSHNDLFYDAQIKLLWMHYGQPGEGKYGDHYRFYELADEDNIIRTTVMIDREENGTAGGKRYYLSEIRTGKVTDAAELEHVKKEQAFAIGMTSCVRVCEALQESLEALTQDVSYKAQEVKKLKP